MVRLVPRPRQLDSRVGAVRFDPPLAIATTRGVPPPVTALLETLLERETNDRTVRVDGDHDVDVRLILEDRPSVQFDDEEGYVLEADVDAGTVMIRAETADGLRHGCQTFTTGLVSQNQRNNTCDGDHIRDRWAFPACTIHDWPATDWRGFLLDPAWGVLSTDRVKRRIDQAARAKMNRLRLRLLDDEGYALESAAFPELNRGPDGEDRPAYSPDDVGELVEYAARHGIEVVPEINVPSHAEHVLGTYPELGCTVEDGDPSERTICIGSAETLEFVETLLAEVVEQFPFDVVHVGGDDWEMHGHSWNECVDCQAKRNAHGFGSDTEYFYAFVRHVHQFLAERGRRTMLWNDQIDVAESPNLPRDILIQFWRVAAPGRGPVDGCSLERFLEEGFDVVNSYVYASFVRGWISEEYLYGWAPRRRPTVPDDRDTQVRGGELLAFKPSNGERRDYFERALPSAIPVFADRLWNPEPIDGGPSFRRTLTRHTLGPYVPDGLDVFRDLGGTILPTNWKREGQGPPAHANRSIGDRTPREAKAGYRRSIETLSALRDANETVYPETATAYIDSLEWLLDVADREGRGILDWT